MACRITRTSAWTARLTTELSSWSKSAFVTLTYDDEHLPKDRSLHKEDVQKFLKRVRKNYDGDIKYYCCGEYGTSDDGQHRPHYHLIMFGMGTDLYSRTIIQRAWPFCNPEKFLIPSFKGVGTVTPYSIRYVSGYVQKKLTGEQGKHVYLDNGLLPPFSLCSQKLGLKWAETHKDLLVAEDGYNMVNGKVPIPRYIREKLDIPSRYFDVAKEESEYLLDHGFDKDSLFGLYKRGLVHYAYNEEKDRIIDRKNKESFLAVKEQIK